MVYPIESDIALITAGHLYFTKIITLIYLTLNLLLMSWWFHGCYLFAFLPWCVCVWCLEPLDLTNFFGMLPEEWIKLLINPYESTFVNLIYYLGWGSLRVFWIMFILLNSRVRASSSNLNSRQYEMFYSIHIKFSAENFMLWSEWPSLKEKKRAWMTLKIIVWSGQS